MKDKPHNGGQWTEARFRSFIMSALRHASNKWGPKWKSIESTYVGKGKNPKTGRACKLHRCALCGELFPKGEMRADHIEPVHDPAKGFESWDSTVSRMFVEVEGYQAICIECHKLKTDEERKVRQQAKKVARRDGPLRRRRRRSL